MTPGHAQKTILSCLELIHISGMQLCTYSHEPLIRLFPEIQRTLSQDWEKHIKYVLLNIFNLYLYLNISLEICHDDDINIMSSDYHNYWNIQKYIMTLLFPLSD